MSTESGHFSFEPRLRGASRKHRVYVLREFLWKTYGDYLSSGDVVLDAAGGKGDLSWLLVNVDGVASVVVDPRNTKQHIHRSIEFLRQFPEEAKIRAVPGRSTHQPIATLMPLLKDKETFQKPRHLRILVDEDLVEAVRNVRKHENADSNREWKDYWKRALARGLEAQTLGYKEEDIMVENHITDAAEALDVILKTRLIVGFHPDQATEPCMDLAMELKIPFCVVPCCVFPKEFPSRRLDGELVKKYLQLIPYLQRKYSVIRTAKLDFHQLQRQTPKNIALYTLPSDCNLFAKMNGDFCLECSPEEKDE